LSPLLQNFSQVPLYEHASASCSEPTTSPLARRDRKKPASTSSFSGLLACPFTARLPSHTT